jgi:hypothetical protein
MKKRSLWNIFLYFCIFGLVLISILLIFSKPTIETFFERISTESAIPKRIWTYWEGEMPDLVQKCIASWSKYNPEYEIVVLNKKNLFLYLPKDACLLSGIREDKLDIFTLQHANESSQRFSDYVRLYILPIYGGFWMDSSIICQSSLQWIRDKNARNGFEFIGYYREGFSSLTPTIESWFFACIPGSNFVKDWRDEFLRMTDYATVDEYVKNICDEGIDISKIPDYRWNYLAVYLSIHHVLQRPKHSYNLDLIKSDDTALKHWIDRKFDSGLAADDLLTQNEMHRDQALIKIVGVVRKELEKKTSDFSVLF